MKRLLVCLLLVGVVGCGGVIREKMKSKKTYQQSLKMKDFGRWYRAYVHEKGTEGPKNWNELRNYLVETGVDASSVQEPGEWGCVPIWGYHFDNVYAGDDKTIVLYERSTVVEGGLVTTFMGAVYELTAEEFANMMDGMSQAEKKARDEATGQAEENPAEDVEGEQ